MLKMLKMQIQEEKRKWEGGSKADTPQTTKKFDMFCVNIDLF